VTGALDQLFQIDLVLAEGGHRLALGLGDLALRSFGSERITRMPRPPPPQDALSMTG
jgi:hypothetical protein